MKKPKKAPSKNKALDDAIWCNDRAKLGAKFKLMDGRELGDLSGRELVALIDRKARENPGGATATAAAQTTAGLYDAAKKSRKVLLDNVLSNNAYRKKRAQNWKGFMTTRATYHWHSSGEMRRHSAQSMATKLIAEWTAEQKANQDLGLEAFVDYEMKVSSVAKFLGPIRKKCVPKKNQS